MLALAALLALAAPADAYRHRMPQPPHIWAHHEPCPDGVSMACADPDTGEIWVAKGSRFAWSHEIGHVWWERVASDADRDWITRRVGFSGGLEWWEWYGYPGFPSPSELSADAYAACDLGLSPAPKRLRNGALLGSWTTSYGYVPSARQHRTICARIVAIGRASR